jgi:hypothetical protein
MGITCGGGGGTTRSGRSADFADAEAHAPANGARTISGMTNCQFLIRTATGYRLPAYGYQPPAGSGKLEAAGITPQGS